MNLVIVPARLGSKRIPRKNIRKFCGRPMLQYALATAKEAGVFDVVHVSSESSEVLEVAKDGGAETSFQRPAELAGDETPILQVVKWVASQYRKQGAELDSVCLLMACTPLLRPRTLAAAFNAFTSGSMATPLLAVQPFANSSTMVLTPDEAGNYKRADLSKGRAGGADENYYRDAGSFCFYSDDFLRSHRGDVPTRFSGFVLKPVEAVDINTEEDWELAEAIYLGRAHRGS